MNVIKTSNDGWNSLLIELNTYQVESNYSVRLDEIMAYCLYFDPIVESWIWELVPNIIYCY